MSRYILGQAVACGGTARGFSQGRGSASCGVFASDWLADRLANTDTVFQNAAPVQKELCALADYFAGTAGCTVPGRYSLAEVINANDGTQKVLVTVYDHVPTADYVAAADAIKKSWGTPMAVNLKPKVARYLQEKAGLVKPQKDVDYPVTGLPIPGEGPTVGPDEEQARLALLAYFRQAGMNLWTLSPAQGTGHLMATHVTATEFWIFDSLVGEAMIPLVQLDNWFKSKEVVNYLNKYLSMSSMNFVPQKRYI